MASSLLAHLYSRIRGSQEDIATVSLQYILSQSTELNQAFTNLLSLHLHTSLPENLQYHCQAAGDDQERPDLSGTDASGHETVLCEMKFYAGLTANQPLTYLKRLSGESGQGLAFVCPKARQTSLWTKLQQLCANESLEDASQWCVKVNGIPMAVITWAEVIETLRHVAAAVAVELLSDIQQLEGYCAQMDSDAFIPFRAEDLTAGMAKRIDRYYIVVEQVFDRLCADKILKVSGKGLRGGGNRNGYARYFRVNEFTAALYYNLKLWGSNSSIETPFWLCVSDNDWKQPVSFQNKFSVVPMAKKEIVEGNLVAFALEPLFDATLDEVCEDLKRQILAYLALFIE